MIDYMPALRIILLLVLALEVGGGGETYVLVKDIERSLMSENASQAES